MYKINDLVVYGKNGVCKIDSVGQIDIAGSDKQYYTLIPVYKKETVIYAPVEAGKIVMRYVISKEEAQLLIASIPDITEKDVENEKDRENYYKQILFSCDLTKIVTLLKTISSRKNKRISEGKKVMVIDEKYYRQAEEQVCEELAFALEIDKNEVRQAVTNNLNN